MTKQTYTCQANFRTQQRPFVVWYLEIGFYSDVLSVNLKVVDAEYGLYVVIT